MRTFEAAVIVRNEDIVRALIKALSDAILYVNGTAPEGMWSSCSVIIDGNEREAHIYSFTADSSEVTDVNLRVFGNEQWHIHLTLDEDREKFLASSIVSVGDE